MVRVISSRGGVARNGVARATVNAGKVAAVPQGNGARKPVPRGASPQKPIDAARASELDSAYAQIDELRQDYRRAQSDLAEMKKKKPAPPASSDLSRECRALKREVAQLMRRERAFTHLLGHLGRTLPDASVVLRERFSEQHYRHAHPDLDRAVSDGHISDLYAHWVVQGSLEDRSVAFWPAALTEVEEAPE